jgi:hypothetical protein
MLHKSSSLMNDWWLNNMSFDVKTPPEKCEPLYTLDHALFLK